MNKNNLYKKYLSVWQFVGDYLRKRKCIKSAKKETSIKLNKTQLAEVLRYWKPYASINPIFHSFYTEKTGVFDERYIPDDLYYTKIDTFYNDWNAAKIVDNKCYYENIFSPVGGGKTSHYFY